MTATLRPPLPMRVALLGTNATSQLAGPSPTDKEAVLISSDEDGDNIEGSSNGAWSDLEDIVSETGVVEVSSDDERSDLEDAEYGMPPD